VAYSFNGSNQWFQTNNADGSGINDWPFTMFGWLKWDSATASSIAFIYLQGSNPWSGLVVGVDRVAAGNPLFFNKFGAATTLTSSGTSADTWYTIGGRCSSNTHMEVVLDGTSTTGSTSSIGFPFAGLDPTSGMVGGRSITTPPSFETPAFTGSIACCCMWNAVLTDRDFVSLRKGLSPRKVRPDKLKFYSPLINFHWVSIAGPRLDSREWNRSSFTGTPGANPPTVVRGPPIRGI